MTKTAIFIVVFAACSGGSGSGDNDFDIPTGDDTGDGSSTLRVDGSVTATELFNSAVDPGDFSSTFVVRVTLDGEAEENAVVTVSSDAGSIDLEFTPGTSDFRGTQPGYYGSYRLDIDDGADFVGGVVLEAPEVHTFVAPLEGARVSSEEDLVVQWSRDGIADETQIESRGTDLRSIDDSGTYTINASDLRQDPDGDEDERIRLYRSTQIAPVGAVAGSEFVIRLRNTVELIVEPRQ